MYRHGYRKSNTILWSYCIYSCFNRIVYSYCEVTRNCELSMSLSRIFVSFNEQNNSKAITGCNLKEYVNRSYESYFLTFINIKFLLKFPCDFNYRNFFLRYFYFQIIINLYFNFFFLSVI